MSYERPDPDRGPYTPPTDEGLAFSRQSFDARGAGGRPLPVTLMASAAVLLVLIVAVVLFYRSGVRSAGDVPPAVGTEVDAVTGAASVDAEPVDPAQGLDVYVAPSDEGEPEWVPPPEAPAARPEPLAPAPGPTTTAEPVPAPTTRPRPEPATAPATPPATRPAPVASGTAAVQIGAFSSRETADREYAAVAAAFPEFAAGRTKRVEAVTTSSGGTAYRTTFNGLSREEAQAFCNALRAAGRECLVR